jgi:hypothetical protein
LTAFLLKVVVHATDEYNAGMQYTLRNIPKEVDTALRRRAKRQGRSLNEVALEALSMGAGVPVNSDGQVKYRDLSDIAGTYVHDPGFEEALKEMDQIDPEDWE